MMMENLMVRITGDGSQYAAMLQSVSARTQQWRAGMTQAGATLTAAFTLPLVGMASTIVRTFTSFEANIVRAGSLVRGITNDEFVAMRNEAARLGSETMFTASQAAEAMQVFARAGRRPNEIIGAMRPTLNLAAGEMIGIEEAAQATANVMGGMQLNAEQLAHATDVLGVASVSSRTSVIGLSDGIRYAGPGAHTLGISLEDLVATLESLAEGGIMGSQAGRGLRTIFGRMAGNRQARAMLDQLGVSVFNAQGQFVGMESVINQLGTAYERLTPEEQMHASAVIAGMHQMALFQNMIEQGSEHFGRFRGQLDNVSGTMQRMADTNMNTLRGSWFLLTSALEGAANEIGQYVAPALMALSNGIQWLIAQWRGLPVEVKAVIGVLAAVAAAVGPLLLFLGFVAPAFATAFSVVGVIFAPLIPIILAVGVAIGLLVLYAGSLQGAWDMVRTAAVNAWTWIQAKVSEFITWSWPIWQSMWQLIQTVWEIASTAVRMFVDRAIELSMALWQTISLIWTAIFGQTQTDWGFIRDYIVAAIQSVIFTLRNLDLILAYTWTAIKLGFVSMTMTIVYFFTTQMPAYLNWFGQNWFNLFTTIYNFTRTVFSNMWRNISMFFVNVWTFMRGGRTSWVWTGLLEGFESTLTALPAIAARELTPLERELTRELGTLGTELERRAAEHMAGAMAAPATAAAPTVTPAAVAAAADAGRSVGDSYGSGAAAGASAAVGDISHVLFRSQEARARIAAYREGLTAITAASAIAAPVVGGLPPAVPPILAAAAGVPAVAAGAAGAVAGAGVPGVVPAVGGGGPARGTIPATEASLRELIAVMREFLLRAGVAVDVVPADLPE